LGKVEPVWLNLIVDNYFSKIFLDQQGIGNAF
jgi:hypothetical protein